jgi:hypothetical protein
MKPRCLALPEDGRYVLAVSDWSGKAGSRASTYRLMVQLF